MGTLPALSCAMRFSSMSVQNTSWPAAARHAPVTSPTYPHPITVKRTFLSPLVAPADRSLTSLGSELQHALPNFSAPAAESQQSTVRRILLLSEQEPAQPEQHKLRLTQDDVPEQPRGLIAIDFAQRFASRSIQ